MLVVVLVLVEVEVVVVVVGSGRCEQVFTLLLGLFMCRTA